jgi:hypothetical protein
MFRSVIFGLVLSAYASVSAGTLLSSWDLNLGTVGGSNAIAIGAVTLNGFSEIDQTVVGSSAFGQAFTFSGSLQWVQYQKSGAVNPLSFGLPTGYTDLYLRFTGLSGALNSSGNASFNSGGTAKLYLDNGGTLIPSANALALASFTLASPSSAIDVAYYNGGGGNAMFDLSFQLVSAMTGIFTDGNGAPILPQAIFSFGFDGLLDPSVLSNPTPVANGNGTSVSMLINAGQVGAVNVVKITSSVPEPATMALVAIGMIGLLIMRRSSAA